MPFAEAVCHGLGELLNCIGKRIRAFEPPYTFAICFSVSLNSARQSPLPNLRGAF